MNDRMLIYLAGPYTHPDPVENTHRAVKMADELIALGYSVIVPHVTLLWHLISPQPVAFWLKYDKSIMVRCDAVYRMKGFSSGADGEVALARAIGMPVFYEKEDS